jgi:hypothetical protein
MSNHQAHRRGQPAHVRRRLSYTEDYQEQLQTAITASSELAVEDTLEDALGHMSGLAGMPTMRILLLAILGLDDILASGQLGDVELAELRSLQGRLRERFEGADADGVEELNDYKEAMYLISHVYSFIDYTVYNVLLAMHTRMCEEEVEAEELERTIRVAREEAEEQERREAEKALRLAEEASKPRLPTADERRAIAAARVARFAGGGSS